MNPTHQFWLFFALVNVYYFFPRYLLEIFHTQFFPIRAFAQGSAGQRLRHLLIRKNYDVFRMSVDMFALTMLYIWFLTSMIPVTMYVVVLSFYFLGSLVYQVYYHAFHRIYHLDPVFFNDFLMLRTAGQLFIHEYGLRNFIISIAGLVYALSGAVCIYYMISSAGHAVFGPYSVLLMIILAAGATYSVLHYPYGKYPQLTFQCQFQSFIRNIILSKRSKRSIASLTVKYMRQFNADPSIRLAIRPNIYLIVVESYGRVLLQDELLCKQFLRSSPGLSQQLLDSGWQTCSAFTTAPVTGGASWISYTSMMYGLNVRNQGVYLTLMKNTHVQDYDSAFHWLKRQGYATFRISGLGGYEKMEIPYDAYSRLYGIDHWIKYKDLDYRGKHYGFGPCPPDQYSLWKGDELSDVIAGDTPKALFFITQNSHTPYDSPTSVAEDWKALNSGEPVIRKPSAFWSRPKFEQYGAAMEYQMRYLVDFIVRKGSANDVFILVGDHQPPSLSISLDTFDTPMHVISKDPRFIDSWAQYGFVPGLLPDNGIAPIRQEAIHWALLRSLISTYCNADARLPEFLPNGISY